MLLPYQTCLNNNKRSIRSLPRTTIQFRKCVSSILLHFRAINFSSEEIWLPKKSDISTFQIILERIHVPGKFNSYASLIKMKHQSISSSDFRYRLTPLSVVLISELLIVPVDDKLRILRIYRDENIFHQMPRFWNKNVITITTLLIIFI